MPTQTQGRAALATMQDILDAMVWDMQASVPDRTNYAPAGSKYLGYMNPFNTTGLTIGTDYANRLYATPTGSGVPASESWPNRSAMEGFHPVIPNRQQIFGYMQLTWGNYYNGVPKVYTTPRKISAMSVCKIKTNWRSLRTGNHNMLMESFLTNTSGNANDRKSEVGLYCHGPASTIAYHNTGTNLGTWTNPEDNLRWTCFKHLDSDFGASLPFITLMREGGVDWRRGVIDYRDLLLWLITRPGSTVTGNEWINGGAFGPEPSKEGGAYSIYYDTFDVEFA